MKQYEKDEYQAYLDKEKATIAEIKKSYESALAQVDDKIRILKSRTDIENMPSIIHQQKYQEQIKKQLEEILGKLQAEQYKTTSDYLNSCYTEGYLRTMYGMQQQGVPFAMPIDQKAVKRAVELDSKISGGLYSKIVDDVSAFKRQISAEISRGIASSLSYTDIARNLRNASNVPISNASRIVRTEGHRIQNQAKLDSMNEAKDKGADVVKQWDATLDGKTRETHRELDGQIVEADELFEIHGLTAKAPGYFGDPAEDCNCRCTCLIRARWALSSGFSKMDNFTKELQDFESPEDYEKFKEDYWSKENIDYMNYVEKMEEKYDSKDFEKVLDSMTDKEYEKYQELMKADPLYKIDAEGADSGSVQSDAQKINDSGEFHCYGDYLRDVLGSAKDNNKEELDEIIASVKKLGGDFKMLKDSNNMVTNIFKGIPGTIEVDENASIAAIKHEYRHFIDDLNNGCPGLAYYLKDKDIFFEYELHGYQEELEIARKLGYNDIEEKILEEIEKRRREIYGE